MLLRELPISDGQIKKIESSISNLNLVFNDWRNQEWLIVFRRILSIQNFSVEGQDLSHIEILSEDYFKEVTMKYFPDQNEEYYRCYSFYGAWSEKPLLKIIAESEYEIISFG